MTAILFSIFGVIVAVVAIVAFRSLWSRRRSGPHNNWKNDAYLAREEAGSWAESEHAVGKENDGPSSVFPGIR